MTSNAHPTSELPPDFPECSLATNQLMGAVHLATSLAEACLRIL
jgi:hypothetical protein